MKADARPKQLKVFAVGLPILLTLFAWRHSGNAGFDVWVMLCVILASASVLCAVFFKQAFERFFDGWMKAVGMIGFCVMTVILTILYYGVFTPLALAIRLKGKDFMSRYPDGSLPTYWIRCGSETKDKESYLQQF